MNLADFIDTGSAKRSPDGWSSPTRPSTGRPKTDTACPSSCAHRSGPRQTPSGAQPSRSGPAAAPPSSARWAPARPISQPPPRTWPASRRVLGACAPPHLVRKWKREIEETVPGAHAAIVTSITDLERLRTIGGDGPLFAVMSPREGKIVVSDGSPQSSSVGPQRAAGSSVDEVTGEPFRVPCCPDCYAMVLDTDGVPLTDRDLSRRRRSMQRMRLRPVAGRQLRPTPLSARRLHQAQDGRLLQPARSQTNVHEFKSPGVRRRASPPASSPTSAEGHSA